MIRSLLADFSAQAAAISAPAPLYEFPATAALEFYECSDFPWLDSIEAATEDVRAELINLLQEGPTALTLVRRESRGSLSLRWFTPTKEVPLCGHVTLGAAHVLWNDVRWANSAGITFHGERTY